MTINGAVRVCYDTHDSWEVDPIALEDCDWYFKRSYAPARLEHLGTLARRVRPLGLNYPLASDDHDWSAVWRAIRLSTVGEQRLRKIAAALPALDVIAYAARHSDLRPDPTDVGDPRILFAVNAWDPAEIRHLPEEKLADRVRINEQRYACIKLFRSRFGERFVGGFIPTAFARRQFGDALLSGSFVGHKRAYLDLARTTPICIATAGLHGSTGWKFAEYVALSRAIVSEPLQYEVTGDLAAEEHYLEFREGGDAVGQIERLLENPSLRQKLMNNNCRYYERWLRPDAAVLHTIEFALAHASA